MCYLLARSDTDQSTERWLCMYVRIAILAIMCHLRVQSCNVLLIQTHEDDTYKYVGSIGVILCIVYVCT